MRRNFSTYLVIFSLLMGALAPQPARAVNNVDLAYLGNSAKNWIRNGGAEQGRAGWVTYADAAGTTPVACSGGSATANLWTVSATTPLADQYSFVWAHPASNVQGNGVAYDFTIDKAQQGKQQRVSLDYEVASGTFTAGQNAIGGATAVESDLEAYVYDKTNGALVGMTNNRLLSNGTAGQNAPFTATFQAASNSTSYRLCLHAATTVAVAHTLRIDSVKVSPQVTTTGGPTTDPVAFTPALSAGFGTATNNNAWWVRVGPRMYMWGTFTAGTVAATVATIGLPSGYSVDTSKIDRTSGQRVGEVTTTAVTSTAGMPTSATLFIKTTDTNVISVSNVANGASADNLTALNVSSIFNTATPVSWSANFPVSGWASNVAMSSDFDGRIVALTAGGAPANVSANAPIIWPTVLTDTHGAYNATTGQYTVPQTGWYLISASLWCSTASASQITIYKGGVNTNVLITGLPSTGVGGGTAAYFAKAGDVLTVVSQIALTSFSAVANLSISRVSGLAQLAAADTVAASYNGGTATVTGSYSLLKYQTLDVDTLSIYSTSTGLATIPVAGTYEINAAARIDGTYAAGNDSDIQIWKNSVTDVGQGLERAGGASLSLVPKISRTLRLVAGDTLQIRVSSAATTPTVANTTYTWLSIKRVGN